jgi:hypothetical protein
MSRSPRPFTQADVTSAVKGALRAGLPVHKFEIDRTGKIVVITGNTDYRASASDNEWDVAPAGEVKK